MSTYTGTNGSISIDQKPDGSVTITLKFKKPKKVVTFIARKRHSKRIAYNEKVESICVTDGVTDGEVSLCRLRKSKACAFVVDIWSDSTLLTSENMWIGGFDNDTKEKIFEELEGLIKVTPF